jgi:hypothetical protein
MAVFTDLHLCDVAARTVEGVDRTGHARVEGVDGAQDFEGVFGVRDGVLEEGGFVGAEGAAGVAGAGVPGSGDDGLVVLDGAVFDDDPVGEQPRGFVEADAFDGAFGELGLVVDGRVAF